ncbi:MogA/MoaB family molybdenum cofactor biosynthesis protein [Cohnella silvisoli]|uniref:Molybdenum cofactor biosynthesis protein B n=1 Tax=Cohnella silvisoli TaxID=2873699 RepID=A0ABV1KXF7_9BACL|nr:MogA/MoaB family molybdenum cofactor biosynthesis protein [Cohnella silvisoli]MCD9024115.1 MogA/MoaB family molybdenum cofactor biosynthesis protein [Cohnella silvisoli]
MVLTSTEQHRREAPSSVSCAIITVSDTRTPETDKSGQLIRQLLEETGFRIADYAIVPDEYEGIKELLRKAAENPQVEAVLLNGGTGIAVRDTTYEAVRDQLDKEMPGFGEIFRYLSFTEDIGSAAILSRAIAGTMGQTAVFSMPGSTGAVRLAMTRLILPELGHVMREIYKDRC